MVRPLVGKVPGWEYELAPASEPVCSFCKRDGLPTLLVGGVGGVSVCEPCSMLLAWIWRDHEGFAVSGGAYPKDVKFVLVLIVRERENDFRIPFDVLEVERKDESGAFGLPGGKVEPGETPAEAAVRELAEEVGIEIWPSSLEVLYTGYSPRAALGTVFLCRGYNGEPEEGVGPEGTEVSWKPWPPGDHAKHLAGFYTGVALAFDQRWRAHRQVSAKTPLSLRLGEPAVAYLERRMAQLAGNVRPDDGRMLDSFKAVMSQDESDIVEVILTTEERKRNTAASAVTRVAQPLVPDADDSDEVAEEEDDENDAAAEFAEGGEGSGEGGFVRPPTTVRRPPT